MKWLNELGSCNLLAGGVLCDGLDKPDMDEESAEVLDAEAPGQPMVLDLGGEQTAH